MSEQQPVSHDAFEKYLFTKLFPFIIKYRYLLTGGLAALVILFIAVGAHSVYSKNQTNSILDDIYLTLSAKKEVTAEVLEELNNKYPDHPASLELKWLLAGKYSEADDYDNAMRVYQQIIDLSPGSGLALHAVFSIAACQEAKNNYEDAVATYDSCISKYSSNNAVKIYALYKKASALYEMKQYAQANNIIDKIAIISAESGSTGNAGDIQDKINMLKHRISINKN